MKCTGTALSSALCQKMLHHFLHSDDEREKSLLLVEVMEKVELNILLII